jgi:signal peptidase I
MTRGESFKAFVHRNFWRGLVAFFATFTALAAIRSAVADWSDVPSGSMTPTILVGDHIYVNKLAYDLKVPFTGTRVVTWADPHRGDVVILRSPANGKMLVKRVVAVPGDAVEPSHSQGPMILPPGKYFVMGDNRDHSLDSRYFGSVDRTQIIGRAVGVVISLDPNHYCLPRWGRFFSGLN